MYNNESAFWDIHFPKLIEVDFQSFSIHALGYKNAVKWISIHSSLNLRHLSFSDPELGSCKITFQEPSEHQATDDSRHELLLKIDTFYGDIDLLGEIIEVYPIEMQFVRHIEIMMEPALMDNVALEVDSLVEVLLQEDRPQPLFPHLKELKMHLKPYRSAWQDVVEIDGWCLDLLGRLADVCGQSLTHWMTCLPFIRVTADVLGESFARFPLLTDIILPADIMGEDQMEEYALGISAHCPNLHVIHVMDSLSFPDTYLELEIVLVEGKPAILRKPISMGSDRSSDRIGSLEP